jgi:hypothetical protein
MKQTYVHQTRTSDNTIKVIVTRAANHTYESQGETAIFAHQLGKHGKWYVGYGGDYVPATKEDITNISNIRPVSPDDERGF